MLSKSKALQPITHFNTVPKQPEAQRGILRSSPAGSIRASGVTAWLHLTGRAETHPKIRQAASLTASCSVKLQDWLPPLKKEMGYILKSRHMEEEKYKTMRNKVRDEKQKIVSEIEQLRQLLRNKEQTLYWRLEEMEKTITMVGNANISKLSNQITSLNALITDLQKKCEEPALDLLKDVKSLLIRCNNVKFQSPAKVMMTYKVMVTLEPDTAHPRLLLSEGRRRVRRANKAQPLPDTPKRFTYWPCVLGSEGFTSGRHYWEVQLLQEGGWRVGVAAESVKRKEWIPWSPEGGVWAVEGWNGLYCALTSRETPLSPHEKPLNLGVYLDYEGGRLSLYNADSMELLYTFPRAHLTHRLFPFFCLWGGAELRLV